MPGRTPPISRCARAAASFSKAVTIAAGVNAGGRREVLGTDIGRSGAAAFRIGFRRESARRGLRGARPVVSDAREGVESGDRPGAGRDPAALPGPHGAQPPGPCRQAGPWRASRFCRRRSRPGEGAAAARARWRGVAGQLRPGLPEPAAFMGGAGAGVPACMDFPAAHRAGLHSTNPLERLDGEVRRRAGAIGTFPGDGAAMRLAGAIPLGRNGEWPVQRGRYMTLLTTPIVVRFR